MPIVGQPISFHEIQRILRGSSGPRTEVALFPRRIGPTPQGQGPVVTSAGAVAEPTVILVPALPSPDAPARDFQLTTAELRQEEILRRAFTDALYQAPPLIVQSSPQEDAGVTGRSTEWVPPGGVVIVQGGSAGAIAAADALRLGVAGVVNPFTLGILAPVAIGSSGAAVVLWSFFAPDDRAIVARRFKIDCSEPYAYTTIQFSIVVSGGEQALPFFNAKPDDWFPLNVAAKPGESVSIVASCLDSTAAYILKPRVDGWTIPVGMIDDSLTGRTRANSRRSPV